MHPTYLPPTHAQRTPLLIITFNWHTCTHTCTESTPSHNIYLHPNLISLARVGSSSVLDKVTPSPLLPPSHISLRRDYGPLSDPPHYFEEHVWPAYMRDLKVACDAHQDGTVSECTT